MYKIWKYCAMIILCCLPLHAKEYVLDHAHSSVSFRVKHLSVADTIGTFQEFDGTLDIENNAIQNLQGSVVIASINTNNSARDEELLTKDFFYGKEATLKFISFQNNTLRALLTLNNVSKEVAFTTKITGPIRNPSLDLKERTTPSNPFAQTASDIPLRNPHLATAGNDADCGCYVSYGDNVIGVELQGSINRFDFNIAPTTPKELLGQDIGIHIILEASN